MELKWSVVSVVVELFYHDLNNLNYTIISKEDENKAFDFKSFSTPVINTLAELGVKAEFTGRNDLEIDGKKFCGNATSLYQWTYHAPWLSSL